MTVRDLLKAEPAALSVLVNARHITSETIAGWQDQARLVCTVPGLRGTHAQLLVGAGYNSGDAIADAEPDKLCADVLAFAATDGRPAAAAQRRAAGHRENQGLAGSRAQHAGGVSTADRRELTRRQRPLCWRRKRRCRRVRPWPARRPR